MKKKTIIGLLAAVLLGIAAATLINLATQVSGLLPIANGGTNTATAASRTVFVGPATSSGAPSFRTLTWPATAGIGKPSVRRWALNVESGSGVNSNVGDQFTTAVSGTGATTSDATASTTAPAAFTCRAGSTNGAFCDVNGVFAYVAGRNILFQSIQALGTAAGTSGDNERVWICLSDQTAGTMQSTDNPAGNYACFRYSSAADGGKWKCVTKDGTTQTVATSGISVDTSWHRFEMDFNDSVPNVAFLIDGSTVCTNTTHLPTTATALQRLISIWTTSASATHDLLGGWWFVESDK